MNIPTWLLELALAGMGVVIFFTYRSVLATIDDNRTENEKLIQDNKLEDDNSRREMRLEMKELRNELHTRINTTESSLLTAIEKLPTMLVSSVKCEGDQKARDIQFKSLLESIRSAGVARVEADNASHQVINSEIKHLGDHVMSLVDEVKNLGDCVTNLSNNKEC